MTQAIREVDRDGTLSGLARPCPSSGWPTLAYLNQIGLGRLPGDIVIRRENVTFYFPLVTCLLLSVLFSLVFWVANR